MRNVVTPRGAAEAQSLVRFFGPSVRTSTWLLTVCVLLLVAFEVYCVHSKGLPPGPVVRFVVRSA